MGNVTLSIVPGFRVLPAVGALVLAGIHLVAAQFDTGNGCPRRVLSLAGGVSVAYVFVHVLPSFHVAGETFVGPALPADVPVDVSYFVALVGFTTYYGLEQSVTESGKSGSQPSDGVFGVHLLSFAAYNALFGYLLALRETAEWVTLGLFVFTIGLHLLVVDYGMVRHHADRYRVRGQWVLAAAMVVGAGLGFLTGIHPVIVDGFTAFLGGAIVFNSIKEELPTRSETSFRTFAVSATAYAALLVVI